MDRKCFFNLLVVCSLVEAGMVVLILFVCGRRRIRFLVLCWCSKSRLVFRSEKRGGFVKFRWLSVIDVWFILESFVYCISVGVFFIEV